MQRGAAWAEVIEAYGNEFKIDIKVAGKVKKFLTIICEQFDQILERFAKLNCEKLLPCNCDLCKPLNIKSFYKLSDLKNRLSNQKEVVECPKNRYKAILILPMLEETFDMNTTSQILGIPAAIASGDIHGACVT
ncbi:MAG: hypothetical protein IPO07_20490 [Haliscomenobacter sp.]|nr:hypothetical protein [Haliscomenobacter sp.]MBK9490894.1 hypothetical protein [Haliscomenobacter sp.]